jgi:TolA-binding protein
MHASFAAATAPTSWSGVTGEASGGYVVDLTASSPPLSSFFDQLQHPPQQQHTEEQQHQQEQEQQQQQHRLPVRHPHSSFVSGNANKRHSIVGDAGGGDASKRLRTAVEPSDRGDGQRDKLELQLDGGYISPLLSLLIEQVRDVKRENASLRRDHNETLKQRMQALEEQNRRLVDEVEQLRALVIKYQHQCQHHHQQHHKHRGDVQRQRGDDHECSFFEPTVPTMLAMSTTVAGASSVAVRDNGGKVIGSDRPTWAEVLGMAKHRYIAMHALPFLNHYQSETASAPSPVRDLMYVERHSCGEDWH